jgi:glycopeptide antibiotics resistance protein
MFIEFNNTTQVLLLLAVAIVMFIIKKGRFFSMSTFIVLVFFFYIFKVIQVTQFPIISIGTSDMVRDNGHYINYDLFYSIYAAIRDHNYIQIIGNVLLLFPLGFFIPLLSRRSLRLYKIILLGFMVSLTIELTQLLLHIFLNSNRLFDLDDLLLNTVGALIGYLVFLITMRYTTRYQFVKKYFFLNKQ